MTTPFQKFETTRTELSSSLIERGEEIDLALTALLSNEHVLFVGPPGTAKSMLSDAIVSWMHGSKFAIQINKFTVPEEVFGPISVSGLKSDVFRRVVDGKLPTADVAFIDEIFKASSAILNTMLQVLNERTFRNDGQLLQCPLKLCIAASNEWPGDQDGGGKELGALFDRFLFRKSVRPIATARGIDALLWGVDLTPRLSTSLTDADLALACSEVAALTWTQPGKEALEEIRRTAHNEGIAPGDRRMRKSVRAAQAYAWLCGATEVEPDHLEILTHVLWDDPLEQPAKLAQVIGKIANPVGLQINSHLSEIEQLVKGVDGKDLARASATCKKLTEIHAKLKGLSGAKAAEAAKYCADKVQEIKLSSLKSLE